MDKLIMIIRHAEKPATGSPYQGVNERGEADDKSLTVRGWQRGGGLAKLFSRPPFPLVTPQAIVASAPVKQDGSGLRSLRPTQTIAPLAARLGLEADTRYSKGQEEDAGAAVAVYAMPVLVCWQHEGIPGLAAAIVSPALNVAPMKWGDPDYDSIWVLNFSDTQKRWTFTAEHQRLLSGDAP